jgi:hypothetical protein
VDSISIDSQTGAQAAKFSALTPVNRSAVTIWSNETPLGLKTVQIFRCTGQRRRRRKPKQLAGSRALKRP